MKFLISVMALSFTLSATAKSMETFCLSSEGKENKAVATKMKFDLNGKVASKIEKIELDWNGNIISTKLLPEAKLTIYKNDNGEALYVFFDFDTAEFYNCDTI